MANANVKLGVSGIAQFKQNMQTAKNSLKTLDEQMKLNEKQFKATGDAEAYMQQKSELLKEKLEEQKAVVENAEKALAEMASKGVDKSSKAFQQMQATLARAQGDLIDTQMEMQGIESASDSASAAIGDMNSELNSINSQVSFQTVTEGIDKITNGLKNAAKKAFDLGTALIRNTLGAGAWADELVTTATMYQGIDPSMTPEKLQRMRKTEQLIDTSVESIISSKQKLATAMGKKDIDDIFAEFGIQNTRYGEIRELDDLFWETGEALMKVENEAKRAQMGKKIFGDWTALIPLFQAGREEYEKTMESQSVVSEDAIKRLTEMDDQYQKLQSELETLKMEILSGFAEPLQKGMEILTGLVKEFNEYLQTPEGKEMLEAMGKAVEGLFEDLNEIDPKQVMEGFTGVFNGIIDGFKWLDENRGTVVTALKTIVIGWGALKLTGGALKVLEFISGIRGLAGSTAAAKAAGEAAGSSWGSGFGAAVLKAVPWLAGLGVLLDPNGGFNGSRDVGGQWGDLYDAEGNVTKAGREYGLPETWEEYINTPPAPPKNNPTIIPIPPEPIQQEVQSLQNDKELNQAWEEAGKTGAISLQNGFNEQTKALEEDAKTSGGNVVIGLANGINDNAKLAIAAAEALASAVAAIMSQTLQIHSPSRVMERMGEFVAAGFAEGIENGFGQVSGAVDRMSRVAVSVSGRSGGGTTSRMIDITLMLGPDRLTEVLVPLVDNAMGEEINLMRR